jgi:hypothetical protein
VSSATSNTRIKSDALRPVTSLRTRLPREDTAVSDLPFGKSGSVTFITTWLASHAEGNSCDACEGLGFCTRCDAAGCEECRGGLCERCNGMGLRLEASQPVRVLRGTI